MPDLSIPDEVRQFLAKHVQSVAQLEILLLVSASPDRWWQAGEVYKAVLSNEELVVRILELFSKLGLVCKSETNTYQFSPPSDQLRLLVRNLADLYRECPNRIIQTIYEAPVSEIEEFAKAFKFRKAP